MRLGRISLALVLATSIASAAPVDHVLSGPQVEMLERAHREYGQTWRLFSKRVNGELKTVVFFGEDGQRSVAEHDFTKSLLDRFEHFAIHRPFVGAYENNGVPFVRPHAEFAPHASGAKSVHDLGRFHRPGVSERIEMITTATLDAMIDQGRPSRLDRDDGDSEAILAAVLMAGLAGRLALHLARFQLPRRKNGVRAIARFADHWVQRKPAHKVLVGFVLAPYLPHLEKLLTEDYFFEAGHL